ncbi:MAG: hypothetical protein KJZ87_24715, partial [Thermoguttaceae bacterium]|nr:hypothetical protein [Thermoguttaceae bacterium]
MRDLVIHASHRPGELANVANALSLQGVNLKSIAAMTFGNQGTLRIIPDDINAAREALHSANIRFEEHELVVVMLENRAGELTGVAAKLADAGLNLEAVYVVGLADDLVE